MAKGTMQERRQNGFYDDEMIKKFNDIHKVIYGNGDTKKSFIYRFAKLETIVGIHWALLLLVAGLLVKIAFYPAGN